MSFELLSEESRFTPEPPLLGYNQNEASASLKFDGDTTYLLDGVILEEPDDALSIFTGTDRKTGSEVVIKAVTKANEPITVLEVTVDDDPVYTVTKH